MPSKRVTDFYNADSFAVYGLSATRTTIGWSVYSQLLKLGKRVYAINPLTEGSRGVKFYPSLEHIPEKPQAIIVALNLKQNRGLLEKIKNSGVKQVWFQQGSFDFKVLDEANRLGIHPIKGCALMYAPQTGFPHSFHRSIIELLGKGYQ